MNERHPPPPTPPAGGGELKDRLHPLGADDRPSPPETGDRPSSPRPGDRLSSPEPADSDRLLPVLVVGAGVAGLTAALALARLGISVHLVEREGRLGGQVMRLDKLYPTDHCGFCPVWAEGAACLSHPLVTLHRHTSLEDLIPEQGGGVTARLSTAPPPVDGDSCVFCGLCREACEVKGVPGAIEMRSSGLSSDPASQPAPRVNASLCSRCGECARACPTGAIDPGRLDRPPFEKLLPAADVIFATGFAESGPAVVPEYLPEGHPDVFTAMDFEAWTAEAGPNYGAVRRRINGKPARSIAFIQCAGARDQRFLPYCSSVCCMHALKQARWAKRRLPEASVAVFFTDLRAVGKNYEAYAVSAAREGVILVRSRPGLVFLAPGEEGGASALAVHYEDTTTGRLITAEFDMVVLNGGLRSCPLPGQSAAPGEVNSCGFCREPADVSQSAVQGASAAALAAMRRAGRNGGAI